MMAGRRVLPTSRVGSLWFSAGVLGALIVAVAMTIADRSSDPGSDLALAENTTSVTTETREAVVNSSEARESRPVTSTTGDQGQTITTSELTSSTPAPSSVSTSSLSPQSSNVTTAKSTSTSEPELVTSSSVPLRETGSFSAYSIGPALPTATLTVVYTRHRGGPISIRSSELCAITEPPTEGGETENQFTQSVDVLDRPGECTLTFSQSDTDDYLGAPDQTLVIWIAASGQMDVPSSLNMTMEAGELDFIVDVIVGGSIRGVETTCGSIVLKSVSAGPDDVKERYVYGFTYPADGVEPGCGRLAIYQSAEAPYMASFTSISLARICLFGRDDPCP